MNKTIQITCSIPNSLYFPSRRIFWFFAQVFDSGFKGRDFLLKLFVLLTYDLVDSLFKLFFLLFDEAVNFHFGQRILHLFVVQLLQ